MLIDASEKNMPVCIVIIFIFYLPVTFFRNILLNRNVNSEPIEIFYHIQWIYKLVSSLCKTFIIKWNNLFFQRINNYVFHYKSAIRNTLFIKKYIHCLTCNAIFLGFSNVDYIFKNMIYIFLNMFFSKDSRFFVIKSLQQRQNEAYNTKTG